MRRLDAAAPDFPRRLAELLDFAAQRDPEVPVRVAAIIADVRARGDAALLEHTNRLDARSAATVAELEVPASGLAAALERVPAPVREALCVAAERIRAYHERQRQESWQYREADGTLLGQRVTALDRVGLYVPGGKVSYPSSVLMNALPARVAGVSELVMAVPAPRGELNDPVLAAAHIAGVDARVIATNVAQAMAEDYIRTARANGATEREVLFAHAVPNALLGATALAGTQLAFLISGTVVLEFIFAWPGIGWLLIESTQTLDFPVIQAIAVVVGGLVFMLNTLVDLALLRLDPRLARGGAR